jgi:hypothetical protein
MPSGLHWHRRRRDRASDSDCDGTVQARADSELCAHYVTLPKEPELLRGLRLHWRREMLMSG